MLLAVFMAAVNWDAFQSLPGAPQRNFEHICRAIIRIHYGRYGGFAALAAQPGVEFHLKLHTSCFLGAPDRWYGWQCRWYELPSGVAIGAARKTKIEEAIRTTERVLPDLTDWVLWTRWSLTKSDQDWFHSLKTQMRLELWTASDAESYLGGEAAFLRSTYFGESVLSPEKLAAWHDESVAPIRQRWRPELHQVVDAERRVREVLGEVASWRSLLALAQDLEESAKQIREDQKRADSSLAKALTNASNAARGLAGTLKETHSALGSGDLNLLQLLLGKNIEMAPEVASLPHRLRALRQAAALSVTNLVAQMRTSGKLLRDLNRVVGKSMIAVVAEAGCGKTQLAAQLTAGSSDRPAGVLLHGKNLNRGESLNSLATRLSMPSGVPVPSMESLIAALDAAGQRASRRLPIVIDALNEAEDPRDWKALLASLEQIVRRFPYVLVVCTLRGDFVADALPEEVERLPIEDFGEDAVDAMVRYFKHYKITFTEAELPLELLKHPLTLRLFCEITNPKREHAVGIEAGPGSLAALFDRYLDQATERIVELAPQGRKFDKSEVVRALDEIGIALWTESTRTLDVGTLRKTLGEENRQWTESIVSALEHEGVIQCYPGELPGRKRLGVSFDLLAGHLVGSALLARNDEPKLQIWTKDPATITAMDGPDWHPLSQDIFFALAGLIPRRTGGQLWPMLEGRLRTRALRAAADLEGKYIDGATLAELKTLVRARSADVEEIFRRLWNARSTPGYPLNATFLDEVLRSMSMADRDLRWSEWVRREHGDILADVIWLEKRWRANATASSVPDTLRAVWVMWLLTSTIRQLRDQATRTLHWFGRGNPEGLFDQTIDSLTVNDPCVSERMLAASYGVAMVLQNGKGAAEFRDEALPRFAKQIFDLMFQENAPFASTHSLRRDYAKCIVQLALRWRPGLLTGTERQRILSPFTGGIRNWRRLPDHDQGKYRDGNNPLGFDWQNYTMGGLARGRSTYDYNHPDFVRVKEEVLWRIHDLGYSLARFGDVDAQISRSRNFRRDEPDRADRYGKKYSWIAFYELWGLRKDDGLLEARAWRDSEPHPERADIDPSFPDAPERGTFFKVDLLRRRAPDVVKWVNSGPIPPVGKQLISKNGRFPNDRWIVAHGGAYAFGREIGRTGYVRVRAHFLKEADLGKLKRFLRSKKVEFHLERDTQEIDGFFAGEFPWEARIPYAEPESIRLPAGKRKVRIPAMPEIVLSFGGTEIRLGGRSTPEWRYETLFESVEIVPLAQRNKFSERSALERDSALVPSKQLAEFTKSWLGLPKWSMLDGSRRPISFALHTSENGNSESSLLLREDIVRAYMKQTKSRVLWIISGERQRLSESGMNAAYKKYLQVFLLGNRGIQQLYEARDRS